MKLLDFIICDDIRIEVGNKHTIIGVYDDSIVFSVNSNNSNQWPKSKKLGFFIRILFEKTDEMPDKFVFNIITDSETQEIGKGNLEIQKMEKLKSLIISLIHSNFIFKNDDTIRFQLVFYKNSKIVNELSPDLLLKVKESIKD